MNETKNVHVKVVMTQTQHSILSSIAKDKDVSLSWIIRSAVKDYIEKASA